MSNENDMNSLTFDLPKNRSNVIKVLGVGGGGSNAIDHMYEQGITGVDFVICNTDAQALENSPVPTKIQLGVNLTEGLGAGANPEIGENAALESFDDIKNLLTSNTKMLFITAGMGGGTGTGAAPIIAKQAKEMDILTVGIVTVPFQFEGKMRIQQANKGLEKLREHVDSIIVINNNKLRQVYGNLGYRSGFSKADEVLSTAARGIAEVITHHFKQNVDLHDAKTVLSNSGTAIMGSAEAAGEERADKAIKEALDSPLLNDNKIYGANNVLLLIVSGDEEVTLDEIGEVNDYIQEQAGNNANIIMGVGDDDTLGESISVTVIATGFQQEQQDELVNTEQKKIIHTLEDDQKAEQDLTSGSYKDSNTNFSSAGQTKDRDNTKRYPLFDELDERFETKDSSEEELIDTTASIKDIAVDLENVSENDFTISEQQEDQEEKNEKEQSIEFDMPFTGQNELKDDKSDKHPDQDLSGYQNKRSTDRSNEEQPVKRYDLGNYLEHGDEPEKPTRPEPSARKKEREDEGFVKKTVDKTHQDQQKRTSEGTIDPMNSSIEELRKQADQRKAKMKRHNHHFNNKQNLEELEKQPAYKRAGVELDDKRGSDKEGKMSRTTLQDDEQNGIRLRKNNSYLHDNAD
jgi:cell division protein FtsZ